MKKKIWSIALVLVIFVSVGITAFADDEDSSKYEISGEIYYVSSAESLLELAEDINNGKVSKSATISLSSNINLANVSGDDAFESISNFTGTFEGNGKTITLCGMPLFDTIDGATIKNLTLAGTVLSTSGSLGSLACTATDSTITSCINSATVKGGDSSTSNGVGGLVGNCTQNNSSTSNEVLFESCSNEGDVTSGGSPVGGLVGYSSTAKFKNCANSGVITQNGSGAAGGILGTFSVAMDDIVSDHMVSCSNSGIVINSKGNAGGIVGYASGQEIESCYNSGSITGINAGGIVGQAEGTTTVTNCNNSGTIQGTNTAGIVGNASSNSTIELRELTIYDFYVDGIQITAANYSSLTDEVSYDGTETSVEKSITSDIWTASDYTLEYDFDQVNWEATVIIVPDTTNGNMATSSTKITFTYNVIPRTTIVENLYLSTTYNIPLELSGIITIVSKSNVSDGCAYAADITYYVREEGSYTYKQYTE